MERLKAEQVQLRLSLLSWRGCKADLLHQAMLVAHVSSITAMAAAFPLFHSSKRRGSSALRTFADMTNHPLIALVVFVFRLELDYRSNLGH
jgi:hypothetical protein